jgi:putative two-component system response regulator
VLQIVDVYDALTTERPYKRALSEAEALEIMDAEVRKGWWDSSILDVFKKVIKNSAESHGASVGGN